MNPQSRREQNQKKLLLTIHQQKTPAGFHIQSAESQHQKESMKQAKGWMGGP